MNVSKPSLFNSVNGGTGVRALRESAGLSRTELAKRAGIGATTVWLVEESLVDCRFSTLMRIAAALNVTPDRLLGLSRVV